MGHGRGCPKNPSPKEDNVKKVTGVASSMDVQLDVPNTRSCSRHKQVSPNKASLDDSSTLMDIEEEEAKPAERDNPMNMSPTSMHSSAVFSMLDIFQGSKLDLLDSPLAARTLFEAGTTKAKAALVDTPSTNVETPPAGLEKQSYITSSKPQALNTMEVFPYEWRE